MTEKTIRAEEAWLTWDDEGGKWIARFRTPKGVFYNVHYPAPEPWDIVRLSDSLRKRYFVLKKVMDDRIEMMRVAITGGQRV